MLKTYDEGTENDVSDEFYFEHIYNGIIFTEDIVYGMIEFKVVKNLDILSEHNVNFKDVDYNCAWFAISCDKNGINRLIGPIHLNQDLIKEGARTISDDRYPELDGMIIECVSNESVNLIATNDIPDWMMDCLMNSVAFIEIV